MNLAAFLTVGLALIFKAMPAYASESTDRINTLLAEIDDLWRGNSSEATISMKVKTRNYTREMKMKAWAKGKEKTLVRIQAPIKEKGTATLKSGNTIYTYLPKTDRTIRLTSGMMMGSWMGSHFTNDDLVKESRLLDDYDGALTREDDDTLEITLTPKPDAAVVWGKIVMVVDAKNRLPKSAIYYDEDMGVARTATYRDNKALGGRTVPAVMRMVPADKPDEFTEMEYLSLEFDQDLPDSMFSIGRLRKQ